MAYVFDEIDDIYWAWERLYNNVLDDHAPIKYKSRRALVDQNSSLTR